MDKKKYKIIKQLLDDRDSVTTKYTLHKRAAIQVLRQVIVDISIWRMMSEIHHYRSPINVDMWDYLGAIQWMSSDSDELFSKKTVYDQIFTGIDSEKCDEIVNEYIDEIICRKKARRREKGENTSPRWGLLQRVI